MGAPVAFGSSIDEQVRFANQAGFKPLTHRGITLLEGWAPLEAWGAWSVGRRCSLHLNFGLPVLGPFEFSMGVMAAVTESFPRLTFVVSVNGAELDRGTIEHLVGPSVLRFAVPTALCAGQRSFLVEIRFDEIRSFRDQGAGGDTRPLALGLRWFQVDAEGNALQTEAAPQEAALESRERLGQSRMSNRSKPLRFLWWR